MQFSLKPLKLSYLVAITPSSGKSRKLCHLAFYQTSLHHRRLKAFAAMAKNQNVFHHTKKHVDDHVSDQRRVFSNTSCYCRGILSLSFTLAARRKYLEKM